VPEPLAHTAAIAAELRGVRLGERRLGKIELRGDPGDRVFMTAVGRMLDLLLPGEPNTTAGRGELAALWLGPDAWLLTCPPDAVATHIGDLRIALADVHAAVTAASISGRSGSVGATSTRTCSATSSSERPTARSVRGDGRPYQAVGV